MEKKIRKYWNKLGDIMEWVLSAIVLVSIIAAIIFLRTPFLEFFQAQDAGESFIDLLGKIMNIVIGVEFFKMLCNPKTKEVLDIILIVTTRHLIIDDTTAMETLITIIGIAIIIILRAGFASEESTGEKRKFRWQENKIRRIEMKDQEEDQEQTP